MDNPPIWLMIPARGGSRGLPRKNMRLLGGQPLLLHAVRACLAVVPGEQIVVITDDDEIDAIAVRAGVRVVREPPTTGLATLDDVALRLLDDIEGFGATGSDIFLTVQPTCPFIRPERILQAAEAFANGAGSVVTVVDDRHLGWRIGPDGEPVPDYTARLNRQTLPPHYREVGAIIGCRIRDLRERRTRIIEPIRLIEVGRDEAVDIDDFADWAIAEHLVSRRSVLIRADAGTTLGMGHAYRALAIAQELARHDVCIATDPAMQLGPTLFAQHPFPLARVDGEEGFLELVKRRAPDLVILDQLNTSVEYVAAIRAAAPGVRIITFEDQGSGAQSADLLVSDLYENLEVPAQRQLSGIENSILAPSFETIASPAPFRREVEELLVVFGGSDPSGLTEKTLAALGNCGFRGSVTVVVGPGVRRPIDIESSGVSGRVVSEVRYMPGLMRRADLAISSAGRTITELLSCGVPVLCLAQNDKELTHTHAAARFGVVNLGLGSLVGIDTIGAHVMRLATSPALREILRRRALHATAGRSNTEIIRRILGRLGLDTW